LAGPLLNIDHSKQILGDMVSDEDTDCPNQVTKWKLANGSKVWDNYYK